MNAPCAPPLFSNEHLISYIQDTRAQWVAVPHRASHTSDMHHVRTPHTARVPRPHAWLAAATCVGACSAAVALHWPHTRLCAAPKSTITDTSTHLQARSTCQHRQGCVMPCKPRSRRRTKQGVDPCEQADLFCIFIRALGTPTVLAACFFGQDLSCLCVRRSRQARRQRLERHLVTEDVGSAVAYQRVGEDCGVVGVLPTRGVVIARVHVIERQAATQTVSCSTRCAQCTTRAFLPPVAWLLPLSVSRCACVGKVPHPRHVVLLCAL